MSAGVRVVSAAGRAPCRHACPVDQNVKEYVALVAEGRFREALSVILRTNPFPAICGRVCSHPCEMECRLDPPVPVRWLKRFVADRAYEEGWSPETASPVAHRRRSVAVVGAGPAGLTAARDLALLGYTVELLEARDEPGGMLRWGLPDFRLPREIVRHEVRQACVPGVTLRTGVRLGGDVDLDRLRSQHSAVVLAVGCWQQAALPLEHERPLRGVVDTLAFLESGEVGGRSVGGTRVVVAGATRQGLDAARSAARRGASVVLVTHLDETELPLDAGEVRAARDDGVRLATRSRIVSLQGRRGRLRGVEIRRDGSSSVREATWVMPAVDRFVEPATLEGCDGLSTTAMGTILTDPVTAGSSLEGVFVAGDAASGPKTVIEAVAGGHGAAAAVHAFLAGGSWHAGGRPACEPGPPAYEPAPAGRRPSAAGTRPLEGPAQALAQARRCARCGTCLDCETCHPDCPTRVLVLARPGAEPPLADAGHVKLDASTDPVAGVSLPDRPREVFGVVDPAARVDPRRCLGCGACADACPYEVVRLAFGADGMGVAVIDERACRACGCCVAACPVGAVEQPFWTDRAISTALARPGEDVTMRCRWARDGDRRAVPLPCAGRASVDLVMAALAAGACSVTLLGCGDVCRYRDAERRAGAVTRSARALLDAVGLGAERLARDVPDAGPPPPFIPREQRIEDFPHDRPHARVLGRIETVLSHPEVVARTGNGPLASLAGVRGDTLLATGCQQLLHPLVEEDLGDVLIRDVLHAADLIRRAGARAMLLADERSCGHALEEAGDAAGAARLARLNAESILASGAATVVTTCGRAAGALHAGPLGRSGVPVRHLTSWLVDRGLEPVRAPRPRHVALLVDPADPEVRAAARALLRAAGHRVVLARSARSRPRGRGGVAELLRAAAETGADVVTCTSSPLALDLAYALRPGAWDPVGLEMVPLSTLLAGGGS